MKSAPSFDSTPEFQNFKSVMKRLVAIPKSELDCKLRAEKLQKELASKPKRRVK